MGGKDAQRLYIKTEAFDFKKRMQNCGAHKQIVNIFSAQLGQVSMGINSFFQRICKATRISVFGGIKFREMRSLETDDQGCQILYEGGLDWGSKTWPLE